MKALYISSVEPFSGKTAFCLAIGKQLQADGRHVGYIKPVSTQPWRTPDGKLADEDAAFVKDALHLEAEIPFLTPIVVTSAVLRERLKGVAKSDPLRTIRDAAQAASEGQDVLLVEGGATLRQGFAIGLSNLQVAEALDAQVIVLVRYRGEMSLVDDPFTAQLRFGKRLIGVILNQVPDEVMPFVNEYARPFLAQRGVEVLGALPLVPRLSALSVGELVSLLHANVLTQAYNPLALAETFTVGAMTAEQALSRFRRYQNKAVITGGDRTDIQLAALETSTVALVLTGNLHPSPLILQQAELLHIPVLLVKENTMETVEAIERAYGKTRLGQPEKLEAFKQLMVEHVDLKRIYASLHLS